MHTAEEDCTAPMPTAEIGCTIINAYCLGRLHYHKCLLLRKAAHAPMLLLRKAAQEPMPAPWRKTSPWMDFFAVIFFLCGPSLM